MKVVVLAATGQVGRTVLSELISRGHEVTAVARNPSFPGASIACAMISVVQTELRRSSLGPMPLSAPSDHRRTTRVSSAT
ncbi:NAD(P)H-binding protein [Paraburkholderia guartelaensis]|uniref:NAD(P)H-binding protein n=1 Tax=Paraburkholderia guartelaensis TaxID=2546446 RepID=UPI002AB75E67|nr:NAD(P)H-binding protein [Paraburkholderia guartelaensis]